MLEELEAAERLAGPAHEGLEERELLRRQLDLLLASPDLSRRGIEPQVTHDDHGRPLDASPADERAEPGQELGEGERLRQVVVRAGVEARDPVVDRVTGGQHQHRHPDARPAQLAAGLEAVAAREHHVEDDRVVGVRLGHPERVVAGGRDVRGVALLGEPAADEARHLQLVLDNKNAHAHS